MGLAPAAQLPVIVVGDIDRGGVLRPPVRHAWRCWTPADQALIAGFVVNKFRGDVGLLEPGPRAAAGADRPAHARRAAVAPRACGSTPRTRSSTVADAPVGRPGPPRRRRRGCGSPRCGCRGSPTPPTSRRWPPSPGVSVHWVTEPSRAAGRRPGGAARQQVHRRRPGVAAVERARRRPHRPGRRRPAGARHLRRLPDARPHHRRRRRVRRRRGRRARPADLRRRVRGRARRCGGRPPSPASRRGSRGARLRDPPRPGRPHRRRAAAARRRRRRRGQRPRRGAAAPTGTGCSSPTGTGARC